MKLLAESEDGESSSTSTADPKLSLEEKMKTWEASEEEIKAASLGGITAGSKSGTDGFDVGLWVMASPEHLFRMLSGFFCLVLRTNLINFANSTFLPNKPDAILVFHYLLCSSHSSWLLVCFSLYSRSSKILLTFLVLVLLRWSEEV
jgi:hypothetical protein